MSFPVLIAIISIATIFAATTLGSAFVFFFKKNLSQRVKSIILGFAGGIMVAASFFGLIMPAIEESQSNPVYSSWSFVPPLIGFMLGGLMLFALDRLVPHFHKLQNVEEGPEAKSLSKNLKFFLAVTIHNIPEGLSVGFACGLALALEGEAATAASMSALSLAIGIAVQNVPEGAAVSIPMFGDGMKKSKAFLFGAASGAVEPVFAVMALFLAQLSLVTPWLLAFAAGAMIYVTLDEILPESRENGFTHHAMWSFMAGFALMMVLEIAIG
jgi:ZIP family zinc transporter